MRAVSISPSALLALIALLVPTGAALSQPATMTWPDAVAQLTAERARAETCVALMRKYGDDAQRARGQLNVRSQFHLETGGHRETIGCLGNPTEEARCKSRRKNTVRRSLQ